MNHFDTFKAALADAYRDSRGPERTVTAVDKTGTRCAFVTLSCGHVREFNIVYTYHIGDRARCLACLEEYLSS